MPEIKLTNVTKRWGKFYAVDHLDLAIEDNSFITLLGPSGCGKTTTLRMIAGLETPTSGRITIGDRVVFDSELGINVPANKRKVGFLFQNYALWPNMTVYQNIAFGLSNVKEEMPTYDFDAKNISVLLHILKNPNDIIKLTRECKDKNGKIDESKVYLIFIDTYKISLYTAKKLYGYKLHEATNVASQVESIVTNLNKKYKQILDAHKAKGIELNAEFALVKNGQVVTTERKLTKEEVDLAVRRVSRIVKIGMFMDRYPAELSGGQQQRVAIARTLAPEPTVLFMDEPLSNLDAKLRLEMRYELQRLHVETGSTFVYVTHDQMEAMTLATKICLINNGVLQQYAAPLEVYNYPNNTFVADFVGNPSINFIEAKGKQTADGDITVSLFDGIEASFQPNRVQAEGKTLSLKDWFANRDKEARDVEQVKQNNLKDKKYVEKGNKDEVFQYHIAKVHEEEFIEKEEPVITEEDFVIGVRPEFVRMSDSGKVEGVIYGAMPTGMESTVKIRVGDFLLTGVIFGGVSYVIGAKVTFDFSGENIMLFDRKSGRYITSGTLAITK
ncbi:ABC transporter ATP-binding protein [Anaerosporobacter faecicola]|uniref:ABC transporter ATP-binding protein n=1 Tax=Anaerosporobacter faecicola TaxID=2718714 RepID=UPI00143C1516|nr:ABC transporter ATP-binding protein [Anaerosporobacter faecicola]